MIFVNFGLIMTILIFLVIFFIKSDKNISKQYNPPKFDGENLIPGILMKIKRFEKICKSLNVPYLK